MTALVDQLQESILSWLGYGEDQKRQEIINRNAVRLGYAGANPTEAEIDSKQHGGGPEFSKMNLSPEQAKFYVDRYQQLADADDRNKPIVEQFRIAADMERAKNLEAAPSYENFVNGALRAKLAPLLSQLSTRQQADVLNNKALGDPFNAQGGMTYDTETGKIADMTPVVGAMADLRRQQAQTEADRRAELQSRIGLHGAQVETEADKRAKLRAEAGLAGARANTEGNRAGAYDAQAAYDMSRAKDTSTREQVIQEMASDPEASPLLKVDAANKRNMPKAQRVKIRKPDGSFEMMDAIPRLDGGFDYKPVKDENANPLSIAPDQERKTARQSNVEYYMNTYGLTQQEALDLELMDANRRFSVLNKLKQQRSNPSQGGAQQPGWFDRIKNAVGGGNQKPSPVPQANQQSVYDEARRAIQRGANPDAVKRRLIEKGLDPSGL